MPTPGVAGAPIDAWKDIGCAASMVPMSSFWPNADCAYRVEESRIERDGTMTAFTFDHIHLRSPDPEATAAFYERMFGATVHRSSPNGKPRVDLDFCGQKVFIAQVSSEDDAASPPQSPYLGLDHVGLTVSGIDDVVAELKGKGANFTMEPTTIRPGVRIAFLRGPQDVTIELVDRNV
jgi:catechol 2,3-dioxygenase-like lactoylglutathione lyase family enzyme